MRPASRIRVATNGRGAGADACTLRPRMASKSTTRWLALVAAFAASLGGMALAYLAESPELRKVGFGIFVAGVIAYVAARIAMIRKGT